MKELFDRIAKASKLDDATDSDMVLYIAEEVGEVSTCLAVGKGLKDKILSEPTESELCDVLISSLGLLLRNNEWGYDEVVAQMSKKLERWESRLNKKVQNGKNKGQDSV